MEDERFQEKNRVINPAKEGYVDRKMKKWEGLILTEHREQMKMIKRDQEKMNEKRVGEKQDEMTIASLLFASMSQKQTVNVQQDIIENGQYIPALKGVVQGFDEKVVYLNVEGLMKTISMDTIRNVEENEHIKWYNDEELLLQRHRPTV